MTQRIQKEALALGLVQLIGLLVAIFASFVPGLSASGAAMVGITCALIGAVLVLLGVFSERGSRMVLSEVSEADAREGLLQSSNFTRTSTVASSSPKTLGMKEVGPRPALEAVVPQESKPMQITDIVLSSPVENLQAQLGLPAAALLSLSGVLVSLESMEKLCLEASRASDVVRGFLESRVNAIPENQAWRWRFTELKDHYQVAQAMTSEWLNRGHVIAKVANDVRKVSSLLQHPEEIEAEFRATVSDSLTTLLDHIVSPETWLHRGQGVYGPNVLNRSSSFFIRPSNAWWPGLDEISEDGNIRDITDLARQRVVSAKEFTESVIPRASAALEGDTSLAPIGELVTLLSHKLRDYLEATEHLAAKSPPQEQENYVLAAVNALPLEKAAALVRDLASIATKNSGSGQTPVHLFRYLAAKSLLQGVEELSTHKIDYDRLSMNIADLAAEHIAGAFLVSRSGLAVHKDFERTKNRLEVLGERLMEDAKLAGIDLTSVKVGAHRRFMSDRKSSLH